MRACCSLPSRIYALFSKPLQPAYPRVLQREERNYEIIRAAFNPRTRACCSSARPRRGTRPGSFNPRTRACCSTCPTSSWGAIPPFSPRTRACCSAITIAAKAIINSLQPAYPRVLQLLLAGNAEGKAPFSPRTRACCSCKNAQIARLMHGLLCAS